MVTLKELELLAGLLQRAGVTQIEAMFANNVMNRLRAWAAADELKQQEKRESKSPLPHE